MTIRELVRPTTDADGLEALWELPAAEEPASDVRRARRGEPRLLARCILLGWIAVLGTGILLAPAPNPEAVYPWYSAIAFELWLGAGFVAWLLFSAQLRTHAYVVGSLAGLHGVIVGISCRQTAHHGGTWWMYETVAFAALAAAAVYGVVTSRRTGD